MQFNLEIIFVNSYEFLSFTQNVGKNICKITSESLSNKYEQKILDHTKNSATDALKTASKKAIEKAAEGAGDLIGNKIPDRITKASKLLRQNNSETLTILYIQYVYMYIYILYIYSYIFR